MRINISFIRDSTNNSEDDAMVSGIISGTRTRHLKTIAKNDEQLKIPHNLRCDMFQSYYFSKPVPAENVETMLSEKLSPAPRKASLEAGFKITIY